MVEFNAQNPWHGSTPKPVKLYVGNLDYNVSEDQLATALDKCGEVLDIVIIRDRDTKKSKGFGFVQMRTGSDEALKLSGTEFSGRKLVVRLAKDKPDKSKNYVTK